MPEGLRWRGTAIGLSAVAVWSVMIGLVRRVSDSFGATLGMALLYSLAAIIPWMTRRPRDLRAFPRRYLLVGGVLFVLTDTSVGLAVGLAASASQAIEVSIVNYLWPTLTVLLAVLVNHQQKASWLLLPGVMAATAGIASAVGGDAGLDPARIGSNIASNPGPYALALTAAISWSCYNVVTPRIAHGHDGITIFFSGVAICLWIVHLVAGRPGPGSVSVAGIVALIGAAVAVAAGYACWNVGILHGNMRIISVASYMTPILSSGVAALLLGSRLSVSFWLGVVLVVIGSLLSWRATGTHHGARRPDRAAPETLRASRSRRLDRGEGD